MYGLNIFFNYLQKKTLIYFTSFSENILMSTYDYLFISIFLTGMDGTSKIISITKKEPLDDQDPNEGVKFSVKTRAPGTDEPVEFEVELKDQKLIASGQLEDQTATVSI